MLDKVGATALGIPGRDAARREGAAGCQAVALFASWVVEMTSGCYFEGPLSRWGTKSYVGLSK